MGRVGARAMFEGLTYRLAVLSVSLCVMFHTSFCAAQVPDYTSQAKLVVGARPVRADAPDTKYAEHLQDVYRTTMALLEGSTLQQRALERVQVMNPELKAVSVKIKATRTEGTGIILVTAVSTEVIYTRVFLEAMLDEFRAFHEQIREQRRNKAVTELAQDVVKRESQVRELRDKARKLASPSIEVSKAKAEALKMALAELAKKQAATTGAEAAQLDSEMKALALSLDAASAPLRESTAAQEDLELAEKSYNELMGVVHKFQVSEESADDYVMFLERATLAVPAPEPK